MGDNAFSVVANSFAVVGLVDVITRLSIKAIDIYIRSRNTSKDIDRILLELRAFADLVRRIKDWINEYNQSSYVLEDGDALISELQIVLENCKNELNGLITNSGNARPNAGEGWAKNFTKGIWWAKGEQDFQRSLQIIQRLNAELNTALSLMGRKNDLVMRKELKAVRNDLDGSAQTLSSKVQEVGDRIQSLSNSNSALLMKFDSSFSGTHADLKSITTTISAQTIALKQKLGSIDQALVTNGRNQSVLISQQNDVVGRIDELTSQFSTMGSLDNQREKIIFEGDNPGAITLPLELLRSHLAKAIQDLVTDGILPGSEATWLESEFEDILACGHEAAAFSRRQKYRARQTASNGHHGQQNLVPFHFFEQTSSQFVSEQSYSAISALKQDFICRVQNVREFETPIGNLLVHISQAYPRSTAQIGPSFSSLEISFIPHRQLSSCVITTRLSRLSFPSLEPKITRIIQMYNVIPPDSKVRRCIKDNDVEGLKSLFEAGQASVYDCGEHGMNLLMMAALDSSLETYDFLLHRGVSPNYTSLGWGLLPFIWTPLMNSWSTDENYDRIRKMTNLAVQRSCDPNELVDGTNLLHWLGTLDLSLGLTALSEVCSYLVTIGCELEQKDDWSRTPLLTAAEETSLDVLKALISKGANLGEIDFLGRGVLHLAFMGKIKNDSQKRWVPEWKLKKMLETAILAGCDPNALDNSGFSPSDYSIWFGMWRTWTLVLNTAGFTPECIELEPRKETASIVLRKGPVDSQTLPVSNLTITEWIAKRNKANLSPGYSPLHTAADYGDAQTTNDLLSIGFDANYTSDQGQTPLHVAATRGNVNIAKQLHAKGAQLEAQTNNAVTPLYCAVNNRRLEFVTWLLDLDTNVNCADKNGWTPVHLAASSGQLNIAKQLYAKDAQLEAKTISGITPLYHAVDNGQFEIATWLLERNANPNCVNENGWSPLHLAASEGHIDLARQLATKGADLNAQTKSGMSPLHQAVIKERSEIVTCLLEMGADYKSVTEHGCTPLHIAASNGHFDIAKHLYAKGAPVDTQTKDGTTPLHLASCNGHFDLVVWLIQQNAKVNLSSYGGYAPLQVATERGHPEIAKHLYAHGGQIDTRTIQGYTLIHCASASGNSELIAWLIDLKLDVNCPTTAGWVPIHFAAERGHVATINQLLNFGANATAESNESYTPLHLAAVAGHLAVVNRLLELGADPNHRSNVGITPFHCAVYRGRIPVLEAFARTLGDPFLVDGFGRNVLDWASKYPPAFEALGRFHESYKPTTESASETHLTATIQKLLSSAHNSDNWLNSLGHLLLFGGHDNDATTAFEQQILSDRGDSTTRHDIACEMCEFYPIRSSRFVCRECAEIDLCETCMVRYHDGESSGACNKHTFLKVPSAAWETLRASEVNEKGESLEEWLERLKGHLADDQAEG